MFEALKLPKRHHTDHFVCCVVNTSIIDQGLDWGEAIETAFAIFNSKFFGEDYYCLIEPKLDHRWSRVSPHFSREQIRVVFNVPINDHSRETVEDFAIGSLLKARIYTEHCFYATSTEEQAAEFLLPEWTGVL